MGITKPILREKAISLRRQGLSYREILTEVPVAKSTISLWLRSVGLSKRQKQRLTEKKLMSVRKGAEAKKKQRTILTREIMTSAQKEIGTINRRELWFIGTMLYWAEGSKEKEYCPGSRVQFTNTDPEMICVFLRWLKEICNKGWGDITIDLTIHELHRNRTEEILHFWLNTIHCPPGYDIQHVYYKKGNPHTIRKNTGPSYHGTLRINVKSSSSLHRRIAGWTNGVVECLR